MDKVKLTAICRKIFLAYLTYVAVCLALILPALNMTLTQVYQQFTGRQLDYQLVGFNPFSLSVFAYGLRDTNPDGSTLWAMDRLIINPSLVHSLWRGAIGIDEVRLLGLTVQPEKLAQDSFNFSDILEHSEARIASEPARARTEANFTLPRIWIGEFELKASLLQYTESHREKPFSAGLRDFHFSLQDFSTLSEQGDGYSLRAESAQGGVLAWQGDVSASGAKTWGHFSLSQFKLLPIWQFMEPALQFTLNSGTFSIQGEYELDWNNGFKWQVTNTHAALENIDLSQKLASTLAGQTPSKVRWQSFDADIARIDSQEKIAALTSLSLNNFQLSSWHESSRLGLVDMFAIDTSPNENNRTNSEPINTDQATPETANDWQVSVEKSAVNNANLSWLVPELDRRRINLSAINVVIENLSNSTNEAQLHAKMTLDKTAKLAIDGSFTPLTQSANLTASLDNFPLNWANPIVAQQANAQLASGELGTSVQVVIANAEPHQVTAAVTIDNFNAVDQKNASIASIKKLTAPMIEINPRDHTLRIDNINVENLSTEVAIAADGSTNFNHLIKTGANRSHAEATTEVNTESSIGTNTETITEINTETVTKTNTEKPPAASPYQWQVDRINLHDATIKFTDETPLSTFSTRIESFSGQILNINSNAQQALSVDLKGQVDGYAPVTLAGKAKPFLADPAMNLALEFKSIDLGLFNPYSTTFTGWKIEKGLLNVKLDYQLEDKRIVGKNRVVLDQLSLGERIDSRRLVDIPLRLALALLTDENGVADLQVPVSGTTDDPSFSIGAIVWAAVRNSIMKVVTAPFNLLASLVGSDEDLGEVAFELHQAWLTDDAKSSLADLKSALDQRPQLRLGVTGEVNLKTEALPYKQMALDAKFTAQGLSASDIEGLSAAWRKVALTLLTGPKVADLDSLSNAQLLDRLLSAQATPLAELEQLANARSIAVKQYLLTSLNLDAERVFIQTNTLQCKKKLSCSKARVKFTIE
ncbi:DUF748 domain-containing protein [Simiduia curdlanivorans]|uniref:DUF748 domain-containing protein n=1 Tax=Simiduia curdlanivorans TaxID=1492769 RepID=A0ABV8V3N5_9GAMM|nr:DUF748 domain-containing protein [Simiduia curdlanivorans]MDN3640062.1 DUF748 domain-containing protein [Simiduia curdlanivorans]